MWNILNMNRNKIRKILIESITHDLLCEFKMNKLRPWLLQAVTGASMMAGVNSANAQNTQPSQSPIAQQKEIVIPNGSHTDTAIVQTHNDGTKTYKIGDATFTSDQYNKRMKMIQNAKQLNKYGNPKGDSALQIIPVASKFIGDWEKFRSKPYECSAGIPTIGYGTTDPEIVKKGSITEPEARKLMNKRITQDYNKLASVIKKKYNKDIEDLTPGQIASMLQVMYRAGSNSVPNSKFLMYTVGGDIEKATQQLDWNKIKNKETGKLELSRGLVNRSYAERQFHRGFHPYNTELNKFVPTNYPNKTQDNISDE